MRGPELVLDANVYADRDFLHWLKRTSLRRIMPAVAYAELAVHHARGFRLEHLRQSLPKLGIEIEWFRAQEAERAGRTGAEVGDFGENGRDHLVGAHAADPNRFLVTMNTKDFSFLPRVVTPAEAVTRFGVHGRTAGRARRR